VWLVRDAAGEADRLPRDGRAMSVLHLSGGERSSERGMQHLSLLHSEREVAFRVFRPRLWEKLADEFRTSVVSQWL
jgi:hypothetical protein